MRESIPNATGAAPNRWQFGRHEHLAVEGLQLLGLLVLGLLGTVLFFAWPLMRRRRPRPASR
jgi:hypothetical protein